MQSQKKGRARRAKDKRCRRAIKRLDSIFHDPGFLVVPIPYVVMTGAEYIATMRKAAT